MNVESTLAIAGGVFGIVALLGAAFVVLRSGLAEKTADLWKGEAEAQKERADRMEKTLAELVARVEHLEDENKTLRELATSSAAVSALSAKVDAHHAQVMEALHGTR